MIFVVIGVFFATFAGINYYVGLRGWQGIVSHLPFLPVKLYWIGFWIIALSYLAGRVGEKYLPGSISQSLILLGAYWLAAMFYFVLILVIIDLIRLLNRVFHFLPGWTQNPTPAFGLGVLVLVLGIVVYGAWNARRPQIQHYDISINKRAGALGQIKVVMVSDIHLGTIVKNGQLQQMVDMVNRQNPDLIILAGDVIDESVEPFVELQMANSFRQLRARYGVFAALGNHEYIGGNAEEAVYYLQQAGVRVLRDEYVKVAGSFYIVGREDSSRERFAGGKRKPLVQVLNSLDRSLPVIVIDHQPSQLEEAQTQGVDLQLSGHTHRGQLWPNGLITRRLFENDWGYLLKGNSQFIVSSGFGTWGPPVRVGAKPEIVEITLNFAR